MNEMKCLFIGGALHGCMKHVNNKENFIYHFIESESKRMNHLHGDSYPLNDVLLTEFQYRRESLDNGASVFFLTTIPSSAGGAFLNDAKTIARARYEK